MPRIRLTLAYDGAGFAGWQLQPRDRTVQGELERVLARLVGPAAAPPRVHASGRTDSGVHADGQVAHFDAPDARRGFPWQKALNATLPPDVRVLDAREVHDGFHARFDALTKTYAYTLWLENAYLLPRLRGSVWQCGPLDLEALDRAAALLPGEHDFAAFQNAGSEVESTVRTMLEVRRDAGARAEECVLRFTATGFLKQMVRNLVGCLVAVGRGRAEPGLIARLLQQGDRSLAPATAPPQGLCLERVDYPPPPKGD